MVTKFMAVPYDWHESRKDSPFLILFKRISIFNILEIGINIIILALFPYSNNYEQEYFEKIYNKSINRNNKYNIIEIDILNLEKLYSVSKRLSKANLSFSIISLTISFLKLVIDLCNKCGHTKDYKAVLVFNYIRLALSFINLLLGRINAGKIKSINIDIASDINFLY